MIHSTPPPPFTVRGPNIIGPSGGLSCGDKYGHLILDCFPGSFTVGTNKAADVEKHTVKNGDMCMGDSLVKISKGPTETWTYDGPCSSNPVQARFVIDYNDMVKMNNKHYWKTYTQDGRKILILIEIK